MKTLEFTEPLFSMKPPYYQLAVIMDGDQVVSSWPARTTPNIQRPGIDDQANLDEYPVVAGGIYRGQFFKKGHNGSVPAVILESNGNIPGFAKVNPRFPGQGRNITHVHVHEGQNATWPGSAACSTLAPGGGDWMARNFKEAENVQVIIPGIRPGFLFEDIQDQGGVG